MADMEKLVEAINDYFGCDAAYFDVDPLEMAQHLLANGVVVREKGEWILNRNGSATCKKCLHTTLDAWGVDKWLNFCPNCGADMRERRE